MKKIETKEVLERRKRKNQIIIGIVMIILLTLSTAGFAILNRDIDSTNKEQKRIYNGIEFYKQDNFWITQINNNLYAFSYFPDELNEIEINITSNLNNLAGKPLYLVNANSAKRIIAQNLLSSNIVQRLNDACINEEDCQNEDYPIKDCQYDNIIVYKNIESNTTKVYQEQNCIIIEGDIAKGTDKLLQTILKIS